MKNFFLLLCVGALIAFTACQKDALSTITPENADLTTASATDRGGDGPFHHHGDSTGHHPDTLHVHPLDSLGHHHDSIHVHLDTTHIHLDTIHVHHQDTIVHPHHGQGGHPHNQDTTVTGGGCHVPPATITVADLPQAAQDWLTANQPNATVVSVVKVTRPDCVVVYVVKIEGVGRIRFDEAGNKIG